MVCSWLILEYAERLRIIRPGTADTETADALYQVREFAEPSSHAPADFMRLGTNQTDDMHTDLEVMTGLSM